MYLSIKERLWKLVDDRNFAFHKTTRADAAAYLDKFRVFEGLSPTAITQLEQELGTTFPVEFKEYLATFGQRCGLLFEAGADLKASEFIEYQDMAKRLLRDSDVPNFLKEDSLVFYQHQGYTFCCFQKDEAGEQGIYYYYEEDPTPKKIYNNFAEMLDVEVEIIERRHEEVKQLGGYYVQLEQGIERHLGATQEGIRPREEEDSFLD